MVTSFDRVHHQRRLDRIAQRVSDCRLLALVRRMLTAGVVMPDGTKIAATEGTPQGGIVLDELDWERERRGHRFVRYADDSNIFMRSARAGERVMVIRVMAPAFLCRSDSWIVRDKRC